MLSMPTCTQKRMRCGCDRSSMPASILIAGNTKSPCSGCSRRKSLNGCIKSRGTITLKKVQGSITPVRNLMGLKIDLRTSKKFKRKEIEEFLTIFDEENENAGN